MSLNIGGTGPIELYDDDMQLIDTWHTQPGDLYLFRAPGFGGATDGRPRHATGPTTARTSLTLRNNIHGFGGGWN